VCVRFSVFVHGGRPRPTGAVVPREKKGEVVPVLN
jgi:hypothetical protein